MKEVIEAIRQVNQERDWDQFHTPENLAKSIVIEAAELLECFQWKSDYDSKQEVEEEIADVLSYCLQLCDILDLDPREIVLKKLEKLRRNIRWKKRKEKAQNTTSSKKRSIFI